MAVTTLHLQDRLTRLSLAPELGASLVNWQVKATGQALLRHTDAAALASAAPRLDLPQPATPMTTKVRCRERESVIGKKSFESRVSGHSPDRILDSAIRTGKTKRRSGRTRLPPLLDSAILETPCHTSHPC